MARMASFCGSAIAIGLVLALASACTSTGLYVVETPGGKKFVINPSTNATVEAQAEVVGVLEFTNMGCVLIDSQAVYLAVFPNGARVDDDGVTMPDGQRFEFGQELSWAGAYASISTPVTEQLASIPKNCLQNDLVFLNSGDSSK